MPDQPVLLPQRVDWRPALSWLWRRILGEALRFPGAQEAELIGSGS
jgi:hypothetical protein